MCDGHIIEETTPEGLSLATCKEERTRQFLGKILT